MPQAALASKPRTQAERTRLAEQRMIDAAIELLNSVGVGGTTLKAIGDKAGYSRGLATHHFGSKAGLFRMVLRRVTEIWTDELMGQIGGRSGLAAITTAIDAHRAHVTRNPSLIRAMNILWTGALDPASGFKPNLAEFMRIQRDAVAEFVRQGQERGEIRNDVDSALFAGQFYGTVLGINHQWLVSDRFDVAAAYREMKRQTIELLEVDASKKTRPSGNHAESRK